MPSLNPLNIFRPPQKRSESVQARSPIRGNRNVEWTAPVPSLRTPSVATGHSRSHSQQLSHAEMMLVKSGRRTSYHTDTTTKVIDPDARSVRVKSVDVFKSKPQLEYNRSFAYPVAPNGHPPSLQRVAHQSAYVDDIADDLDTRQLRDVLDTDMRRRKRRQSGYGSPQRRITAGSTMKTIGAPPMPKLYSNGEHQPSPVFKQLANGTFEPLMTPEGTPLYDTFMTIKSTRTTPRSRSKASQNTVNPITGEAAHWHDADSAHMVPIGKDSSGLVLSGNRESFPDFAVVDSSKRYAQGHGVLEQRQSTAAFSSLWKRASSARFKKERDLAKHRNDEQKEKHMSGSSSVLYETFDDVLQVDDKASEAQEPPADAFYDPNRVSRTNSRQTHSRNFSRPSDSQPAAPLVYPAQTTVQYPTRPDTGTTMTTGPSKTFSPLNSGNVFPKPVMRQTPAQAAIMKAKSAFPAPTTVVPLTTETVDQASSQPLMTSPARSRPAGVRLSTEQYTGTPGFDSPMAAAGLLPSSPEINRASSASTLRAAPLIMNSDTLATPPPSAKTIPATIVENEGSWLSNKQPSASKSLGDENEYEQGQWHTGVGKPVTIVASPLQSTTGSFRSPQIVDRNEIAVGTPRPRKGSDASSSYFPDQPSSPAPKLVTKASFLTSTDSFYTANGINSSQETFTS